MALGSKKQETVAVLADAAAGVDQHIIADQCALDGRARAYIAVPADPHPRPYHGAGADDRARADLDIRADHGQRLDDDTGLEVSAGIDDRGRRDARNP